MNGPQVLSTGCAGTRHGNISAYRRYGCRCPDVLEAARAAGRAKAARRARGRQPGGWRRGYDWVALERALGGNDGLVLSFGEVRDAVELLTRRGLSVEETARRLGVSGRTVQRHRAALREAA